MQELDGGWLLATDGQNIGKQEGWYESGPTAGARPVTVPGLIQDRFPNYHGVAWYWHTFRVGGGAGPFDLATERLLLRFGAVDYLGEVWLNGQYAGCCEGGETPFEFDVSKAIRLDADNLLAVRGLNPAVTPIDGYMLKEVPHSNRTNSTKAGTSTNMGGITYPVTLRRVPAVYVADLFARPDLHTGRIAVTVTVCNSHDAAVPGALILSVAPDQAGVTDPAQLDFCDELGLMVYEECLASWLLADSPSMGERYDRSTGAMIRRDRNHACITIWGLLNETENGPVFRQADAYLPKLRRLDPTRLVLLSSGRWDGAPSIGSVSNPGGGEWEPRWGVEGANPPQVNPKHFWGYIGPAGDAYHYPFVPLPPLGLRFFHDLGRQDKPVFLSEFGIGPVQDVIRDWRYFQQIGVNEERDDVGFLRVQAQAFITDWKRLGFDDVYPFFEDFLHESQRLAARHRTLSFDLIRANPKICGHNLTALNDGMTGEGLWNCAGEWEPATYDAVTDGWVPLRWCMLADPTHAYVGREITIEAALANEGALRPGDYPVRFRIFGPEGLVWERSITLTIPESSPLAIPVLQETMKLDGPAGQYVFAANMESGGAPSGGRLTFYLSDPAQLPAAQGRVSLWGLNARTTAWLTAHGVACRPLVDGAANPGEVILVYKPLEDEITPARLAGLFARVAAGATVVFLNHRALGNVDGPTGYLPFKNKGPCYAFTDWLYHKECVAKRHPVFAGLSKAPGILDWDFYGTIIPHEIYEGLDTPDETIAASFVTAHHRCPGGYGCGLLLAAYRHGAGQIALNTLYLVENLDAHPAADRLLLNLIRYAQRQEDR